MKKPGNKGIVMVMGFLLACLLDVSPAAAQGSVSFQVFYDQLQPYGTWIQHNHYGYVWMPRVDQGFVPYATNGYWINTEYGNTWVSDYSWGWAPFHYGRWFYDDFYGWMWVPDNVWGPAWVAWRSGGGYYGWAPLMPGLGFSMSFNYYSRIPHHYWSFVPYRYITYRSVYRHCVPRTQVVNVINHTTIVTNNYTDNRRRTYFTGPSRREIERTTQERVRVYSVNDQSRPDRTAVERDRVRFYRPDIDDSKTSRSNSMPSQYMRDNGRGKLEQVVARRERTSESYKERNADNGTQRGNEATTEQRSLQRMDEQRQRDMQSENDAFERFRKERENPSREQRDERVKEMRSLEPKDLERRDNSVPEEQRRAENRQQLEKQNEMLKEQRNMQQRQNDLREEQRRSNTNELRREQLDRQNEILQQRNQQLQRDNAVKQQQRENMQRQQLERQSSPRELNRSGEIRRTERQPQSLQRMDRPNQNRFSQPNSSSPPSGSQEMRRSAPDQHRQAPANRGGSNSPRKRN